MSASEEPVSAFAVYKGKNIKKKKLQLSSNNGSPAKKNKLNSKQTNSELKYDKKLKLKSINNSLHKKAKSIVPKKIKTSDFKTNILNLDDSTSTVPSKKFKTTKQNLLNNSRTGDATLRNVKKKRKAKKVKKDQQKQILKADKADIKFVDKKLKNKKTPNGLSDDQSAEVEIISEDEEPPTLVPIIHKNLDDKQKINVESSNVNESAEFSQILSEIHKTDPSSEGLKLFKWFIHPLTAKVFFSKFWEIETLHIERNSPNYFSHVLSTQKLDDIFREYPLYYTKHVDVVSYENGVKESHNEEGRVVASALYDYYSNGCSIRILNPQTYEPKVHTILSTLQEYFGTSVGANVYLTPPGSQGFAPHYDDIEAFILQLEGRKHWKLYKPTGSDVLARYSSHDFKKEDIGEPFMEVTLNAGDTLYFPRGTIHEGRTDPESHSLHITVSVYQNTSFVDLLEQIVPKALDTAAKNDVEFRKGLPVNYLKHVGHVNKDAKSEVRNTIVNKVKSLMESLIKHIDVDLASDKLGRKFMYDSMSPILSKQEVKYTSKYDGDYMKDGKIFNRIEIGLDTEVRLVRYHCLRLVIEDEDAKIYYNTENAKVIHGEEEQFLIIDLNLVPCIKKLQNLYPKFVQVEDLPIEDDLAKAQLISDLWEKGLIVTNGPLPSFEVENDSDSDTQLANQ